MNHKETRALLAEILHPDNKALSIDLSSLTQPDWIQLIELANNHLVVTSLYPQLKQKCLLENIPHDVLEYFSAVHELNSERNKLILQQLGALLTTLNAAGIRPILLKGIASLSSKLYPDPGMRFLGDIDILIPLSLQPLAIQALQESGYEFHAQYGLQHYDKHHHYPPLLHHDYIATLEVHKHVTGAAYQKLIPADKAIEQIIVVDIAQQAYMFNATYRLLHNLVHTCLQDRNHALHGFSLRQVYEAAMIMHYEKDSINWTTLESIFKHAGLADVFYSYLSLIENLFHIAPDETIIAKDHLHAYGQFYSTGKPSLRRLIMTELKGKYSSFRREPRSLSRLLSKSWYKSSSARILSRVKRKI